MNHTAATPHVLRSQRELEPCVLVIFGASGDLTRRKLGPALYNLEADGRLPEAFSVVCAARRDWTTERCVAEILKGVETYSRRELEQPVWNRLASRIVFVQVETEEPDGYRRLAQRLGEIDRQRHTSGNRLFYLATPPSAFAPIVEQLGRAGLNGPGAGGEWARVVVEKPTGRDLDSARSLNNTINRAFAERDVYRIDHYLGKETVQNLLVFRFANAIFEPLWNQK